MLDKTEEYTESEKIWSFEGLSLEANMMQNFLENSLENLKKE